MDSETEALVLTEELARRFLEWLDLPGDSRQLRDYRNNLRLLLGRRLDCETLHLFARQSKRKYETASRLLSFIASRRGLGLRQLAAELRECLGRKPRSGSDTYVPPDSLVSEAARRLGETRVYHVFLLMLGSGARLSTVHWLLSQGLDPSRLVCLEAGFCRYHIDYVRGEKLQWALYSPRGFWERALEEPRLTLSYSRAQELIAAAGVKAKHLRNWAYNKMLSLGIPEGVVEFIVGHKAASIGRRHYLNAILQADRWYPRYSSWLAEHLD
ncbi:MAG: integrase [Desulfurococcales archaeon]|nr:integrase [Desulfurococcales archaeon]